MKKQKIDPEFEKRKEEILRSARNVTQSPDRAEAAFLRRVDDDTAYDGAYESAPEAERKYAWEYELEQYRKARIKERFYMIGSICGILALALTLILNFGNILQILMQF